LRKLISHISCTVQQGRWNEPILIYSFPGHSLRSKMLLKTVNNSFQEDVPACLGVQSSLRKLISHISCTVQQGRWNEPILIYSFPGHSLRSKMLLKAVNHSFQEDVPACLGVQSSLSKLISHISCTVQQGKWNEQILLCSFLGYSLRSKMLLKAINNTF
jgi:hypothetical protein